MAAGRSGCLPRVYGGGRLPSARRWGALPVVQESWIMGEFTGRRVVVMGGSRGIGRSAALAFARSGASVAICARGAETLEATRKELEAAGAPVTFASPTDLASADDIARFIPAAAEALGGINVLVNNASGFAATDDDTGWAASFNVDMLATVRASQAALALPRSAPARPRSSRIQHLRAARHQAQPALRRHQGRDRLLHGEPGPHPGRSRHPRERGGAGLHRVSRRRLGPAPPGQP